MNTLTIQVENKSILQSLRRILKSMDGVSVVPARRRAKTGMEEALDDIRHGRVTEYKSADDMFEKLGI